MFKAANAEKKSPQAEQKIVDSPKRDISPRKVTYEKSASLADSGTNDPVKSRGKMTISNSDNAKKMLSTKELVEMLKATVD